MAFCAGIACGAVYMPSVEIVPTALFPPGTPLTAQATAVLPVLLTVALNCCVAPKATDALAGDTLRLTGGAGGGGGDVDDAVLPPPQPIAPAQPTITIHVQMQPFFARADELFTLTSTTRTQARPLPPSNASAHPEICRSPRTQLSAHCSKALQPQCLGALELPPKPLRETRKCSPLKQRGPGPFPFGALPRHTCFKMGQATANVQANFTSNSG